MKLHLSSVAVFCFGAAVLLSPVFASAASLNPPYVAEVVTDVTVPAGTASSAVSLKKTFKFTPAVRFSTSYGDIDVMLRPDAAPLTVKNFLKYVKDNSYTDSFFHRSYQDTGVKPIIQGGGFKVIDGTVDEIVTRDPVMSEYKLPNARGTLAMARTSDLNSATSEWYFNDLDNTDSLGATNGGGYTVFGTIANDGGFGVMDTISALTVVNAGGNFTDLPVLPSFQSPTVEVSDLVMVHAVVQLPKPAASTLTLTVKKNTNPGLVTVVLSGKDLTLNYVPGATGAAKITLQATDADGVRVVTKFKVNVQ